jgi:rSAM/selenodomain-associated transferase 2/rSAM/selenodomain-associated transferase 1
MDKQLAIVIPVFRESTAIGPCLRHLSRCDAIARCEVIVVDGDGGSTGTPNDIVPVTVCLSSPGRGTQLNAGARMSTAGALLFLHVDTTLPTDFVSRVLGALDEFPAGAFDLHIISRNLTTILISMTGRLRSRLTRVPYGDQAQFIRRTTFNQVGGFPDEPLMEDVALMDRLKAAGHRITFLTPPARTSDRRWRADGALRGTLRNWKLMRAYRAGATPGELAARYRPHGEKLPGDSDRVILFYRALRPGAVKTRLADGLGDEAALEIYAAMLADSWLALAPIRQQVSARIDDVNAGEDLIGGGAGQRGTTLEERMDNAFRDAFADGAGRVVLIGSDIPGLGSDRVTEALAALRDHDAVIGPSSGGGYYLIGFRRDIYQPVFAHARAGDRSAGTPTDPYDLTISAMRKNRMSWEELPAMRDIDTVADLAVLYRTPQGPHPGLDASVRRHAPHLMTGER